MITCKIDVTKINKDFIFTGKVNKEGKTPKYIDLTLIENKQGVDQYGNAGFVAQSIPKEARDRGEKGAILGNYKIIGAPQGKPALPPKPSAHEDAWEAEADIPF